MKKTLDKVIEKEWLLTQNIGRGGIPSLIKPI